MLAIFASHAQSSGTKQQSLSDAGSVFAEKIVPLYARCLVEVSRSGAADQGTMLTRVRRHRTRRTIG